MQPPCLCAALEQHGDEDGVAGDVFEELVDGALVELTRLELGQRNVLAHGAPPLPTGGPPAMIAAGKGLSPKVLGR